MNDEMEIINWVRVGCLERNFIGRLLIILLGVKMERELSDVQNKNTK
jgi:hypothetical protein